MRRWRCWNCLERHTKTGPRVVTLCHVCYNSRFKNPKKFDQRDPFIMYKNELENLNWVGLNRVRKPSPQVLAFFDKLYQLRRKMKMVFRLAVILAKLQKESAERAYAPGGLGFQYCQQSFNSMALN